MRKCEVWSYHNWMDFPFDRVCRGDLFRLFEENGKPVYDQDNNTIFEAVDGAFLDSNDHWKIRYYATKLIQI